VSLERLLAPAIRAASLWDAGAIRNELQPIPSLHVMKNGVERMTQKAAPLMRGGGAIVLVSSGVHLKGIPMYVTYGATKAALRSFARSMAAELKDRLIRVNTLSPGAIDTPIIDNQFKTKEEADGLREMFKQLNPLGRIGRPEEMAKAVLFLASDDSSYTNASDLVADGGMTQI
jgi:NAD(P)-dependent dehydrogenase (short-subunit alcohol dehydrogenase family)